MSTCNSEPLAATAGIIRVDGQEKICLYVLPERQFFWPGMCKYFCSSKKSLEVNDTSRDVRFDEMRLIS